VQIDNLTQCKLQFAKQEMRLNSTIKTYKVGSTDQDETEITFNSNGDELEHMHQEIRDTRLEE
jgi:hypothetical protein